MATKKTPLPKGIKAKPIEINPAKQYLLIVDQPDMEPAAVEHWRTKLTDAGLYNVTLVVGKAQIVEKPDA